MFEPVNWTTDKQKFKNKIFLFESKKKVFY
jgi:hypothetical protein